MASGTADLVIDGVADFTVQGLLVLGAVIGVIVGLIVWRFAVSKFRRAAR